MLYHDNRPFVTTCDHFERPQLDISLYRVITESAADQSLYFCENLVMQSALNQVNIKLYSSFS
jgi:hypothetical protein